MLLGILKIQYALVRRAGRLMMPGTDRGKGIAPGVIRAASQYGVQDRLLDCLTFDVTRSPIRRGGWVDAIVTDPPCALFHPH